MAGAGEKPEDSHVPKNGLPVRSDSVVRKDEGGGAAGGENRFPASAIIDQRGEKGGLSERIWGRYSVRRTYALPRCFVESRPHVAGKEGKKMAALRPNLRRKTGKRIRRDLFLFETWEEK